MQTPQLKRFCFFYRKKTLSALVFSAHQAYSLCNGKTACGAVNREFTRDEYGTIKSNVKYSINSSVWLTHHQHIHAALKNVESYFSHQVLFIKCRIYFCNFKTTHFSVLHQLADKIFCFPFF